MKLFIMNASKQQYLRFSSTVAYLIVITLFGIASIMFFQANPLGYIVGGGSVFIGIWLLYTPSTGFPPIQVLADAEQFPVLNELVGAVATEVDVPPPPIMLTQMDGCALGLIGVRQRPVLIIGQPLLLYMPFDEKIALLAHEVGHLRDGAFSRSAYHIVAKGIIYRILRLTKFLRLRVATLIVERWLSSHLAIQNSDGFQSEYEADCWSVYVAGTVAAKRILSRIERVWKGSGKQPLDLTHPTSQARLAAVEKLPFAEPRVVFTMETQARLQAELQSWPRIMREREEALLGVSGEQRDDTRVALG